MTYQIECRRLNTQGYWLTLGNSARNLEAARMVAQDIAIELQRPLRIVTYGSKQGFRVHAEFSATGQPLPLDSAA
jgi:hypothetical protein